MTAADPIPTRRPMRERMRQQRGLLSVIVVAELIAVVLVSTISPHDHIDGEVYRLGAQALLNGNDVYENLPATESGLRLPFIYPPFAAILFAPLALVPKVGAVAMIMVLSHLALLATLYVVLSASTFLAAHRDRVLLITAAAMPVATISEPVIETITYAQINLVLMAMVAVDCLWRTSGGKKLPYPRGLLIGLAAGIKLTPAVFLLFFLLRKDYRPILTALGTFVLTALLGLVLAFDDARTFWLSKVMSTSGVSFGPGFTGDASVYAGNQSLRSMLTKLGVPSVTLISAVLTLVLLAVAVMGMSHAIRLRDLPMAVTLNGVLGLLMSPISWSHHWVWAIPALVLLIGYAVSRQDWPVLMISTLAAGIFTMGPHWTVPQGNGRELRWNVFEHFIGNAYVYFGLALLVYWAVLFWRSPRSKVPANEERTVEMAKIASPG
ncbi:glycosyltransferase 87 family protein [Parasphingorhabdus pacifica]